MFIKRGLKFWLWRIFHLPSELSGLTKRKGLKELKGDLCKACIGASTQDVLIASLDLHVDAFFRLVDRGNVNAEFVKGLTKRHMAVVKAVDEAAIDYLKSKSKTKKRP